MKKRVLADRDDDSQNCYVYKYLEGPGGMIVKVWLPRWMMDNDAPPYITVTVKT